MSFLVLVLAVWIEKFSALRQRVQRDGRWLRQLAQQIAAAQAVDHHQQVHRQRQQTIGQRLQDQQ